jgi:hypothetical protein
LPEDIAGASGMDGSWPQKLAVGHRATWDEGFTNWKTLDWRFFEGSNQYSLVRSGNQKV